MVERCRTLNSARDPSLNLGMAGHFFSFFYSSAFLRGLLPCVRTNNLAYVCHTTTSERARTVRDFGPIDSDL